MRKILLFLPLLCAFSVFANGNEQLVNNPYASVFRKAYSLNPSIPKGILESVAWSQSRFSDLNMAGVEPSCIGYPTAYGVMGLTEDGKGYFRNNLIAVSQLSGYSVQDIKSNPEKNILAYAKAFAVLQQQQQVYGHNLADYKMIFVALSELPLTNDLQNDYAINAQLYQLYWFLANGELQDFYGFPDYGLNLKAIFGNNYSVLSSSSVIISPQTVTNGSGNAFQATHISNSVASVDYGPALSNFTTCNYSSRSGTAITMVAIHDVEGTYAGCISWFKNCSANASAHYVIRSSDGQVTQMVLESNKAWHIGSENPYTLGIEHEGYNNNAAWYTTAMLTSSADLVRDMCADNAINPLRCYFGPGCSGTTQQCQQGTCVKIKGHQMFPNQTHNDPGPYWNWDKYYKLLNNAPVITTLTATSGSFYDSGGASANYSNDERKLWLFQPAGATSISMNFTMFNVENKYDYLFIYDGNNVNAPLIGKYTSTVTPGNINSSGSSLLIEFRSDCATTNPGWAATYTTNATVTNTVDMVNPTTQVNTNNAWDTTAFTAFFTDADAGGSGLEKSYYQVIDFDGTEWRGNYTHGFFSDNFDAAIHPEWTQKTGTWGINGNALEQTDEVSTAASNTNIYAALTQTLSNRYLYNFKAKIDGSGTNRRAGFHFFVNHPDSVNRGNSYFVYFRLDGTQQVQLYETSYSGGVNIFGSPTFTAPVAFTANQWYDFKVIYDRITGKMDVYKDNTPIASWTDPTPLASGGYISFRSGNCKWTLDEIKVYRSRPTASVSVSVGTGNTNDARYQNPSPTQNAAKVKSIVNDGAGNLSSIYYHDKNIDWTRPSNIAGVKDGKAADIATVITSDSLSANWSSSKDPHSGIARYWYSIGTTPGATNTLTWTSNWGDTTVTAKSLSLTPGTTYYFNVRSENGAGMFSSVTTSNGQMLTTATNTTTSSLEELSQGKNISVYPNPFNQSIEVSVSLPEDSEVTIGLYDALGREIASYTSKESKGVYTKTIHTNNLNISSGNYFVQVNYGKYHFTKKVVKE